MGFPYPARHCRTAQYASSPDTAGKARKDSVQWLTEWGLLKIIDTVELLVSELVTNAVQATGRTAWRRDYGGLIGFPRVVQQLRVEDDRLLILVWDGDVKLPQQRDASVYNEGGRGLHLVDTLSLRWGYYEPSVGGKVVWSELAIRE